MSKRTIGIILIVVGSLLFLKYSPFDLNFIPNRDILWPLALAGFGLYLISKRNYQAGLVVFYIGGCFSLFYLGWNPIFEFVNSEYYWATVIIVLGLGFILQSQKRR